MKSTSKRALFGLVLGTLAIAPGRHAAAQIDNARPARPSVTLPDGPVRQVIRRSCTACHGIDEYGYYAMDRDRWLALIERMKVTPSGLVEGAVISNADREILLDWLVAEFGPDSTPFERQYIPRTLTDADLLTDEQADARLAASCTECHAQDQILPQRMTEAEWRTRVTREIGRGAALLIDEADPLIEWLTRTYGAPEAAQ